MQTSLSEGHKWKLGGLPRRLPFAEGGDSVATCSFCDSIRNRKADFINENVFTTHYVLATVLGATWLRPCVTVYVDSEVGAVVLPRCEGGIQG